MHTAPCPNSALSRAHLNSTMCDSRPSLNEGMDCFYRSVKHTCAFVAFAEIQRVSLIFFKQRFVQSHLLCFNDQGGQRWALVKERGGARRGGGGGVLFIYSRIWGCALRKPQTNFA